METMGMEQLIGHNLLHLRQLGGRHKNGKNGKSKIC